MLKIILMAITLAAASNGIAFLIPSSSYADSHATISTSNYQIAQNSNQSAKITVKSLGIGRIKLSMTEAQVRKILGKPISVKNGNIAAIGKVRTLAYKGITVDFGEGAKPGDFTVYQIKANNSKYSTVDGVKVGDSLSKVFKTYGKVEPFKGGNGNLFNYSIDEPSPAGITFTVVNNKVTQILCFYLLN